ncbi:HAD-IIB family hydrolase [Roseovarius aestuariivivens]|uniref:HAD-IIB family hydrolase n=1 Tax=Roseovarius aestuariivivens TaxID=1888910 RepID=UPI0010820F7A|nr:HAD hydrolase family protein [Roseovarius aestuariivivens]
MTAPLPLLVFSDLDGTLLRHGDYAFEPARPALDALVGKKGGLILATSKTAAEVAPLRRDIGFENWPAIVENGGGILPAGDDTGDVQGTYEDLRSRLAALPAGFVGFGDMTTSEVEQATGLSPSEAENARIRLFTEPGLWKGHESDLPAFLQAAEKAGIFARRGGRFLTLSLGGTKADRMDELISMYRPRHTVALGDAPNDVEMLEKAEFGVIVKNAAAPPLPAMSGEASGRIRRTNREGPDGWSEAMLALMNEMNL